MSGQPSLCYICYSSVVVSQTPKLDAQILSYLFLTQAHGMRTTHMEIRIREHRLASCDHHALSYAAAT